MYILAIRFDMSTLILIYENINIRTSFESMKSAC